MTEAPVGFRCPECAQSPQVRQPVTVAGATHVSRPVVTYVLLIATVIVFLGQNLIGLADSTRFFGMWPYEIARDGESWRLVTSAFLHGSFLHIAFNMFVLFALGPTLERILGHARYIVLYITAAFGGSVASYTFSDPKIISVGASGAIFGLMGALVVAGKRLRYDITQVLILIGINIAIGFIAPGVDWRAHLGGLVAGAAVAGLLVYAPRRHRTSVQVLGLAGVWAVLIGVALWRTAQVQEFYAPVSGMFT
jgi:membrane associated rhomboid family serine protease